MDEVILQAKTRRRDPHPGRGVLIWAVILLLAVPSRVLAGGSIVVLDPGHGGSQPGARSALGVLEKEVVLAIAKHAKKILVGKGFDVRLTRDEDVSLELDERIAVANEASASVFVSIHANFAPVPERRGVETYILAVNASDQDAASLVHAENEGTFQGAPEDRDPPAGESGGTLGFILSDLEQMVAHKDSALLARGVQEAMGRARAFLPSRGLRQAPFRVLKGARMPAVLVEVGYLSNAEQAQTLASEEGRVRAGEAVAEGVRWFLDKKRRRQVP